MGICLRVSWRLSGWCGGETWCISLPKIALLKKKRKGLHKGCLCSVHLEPEVDLFGMSYPVWPQEVTMDCYSAAALPLSGLPLQWSVLWKILSGRDVQGHSLSPPFLLLYVYVCLLFPILLNCLYFLYFSCTFHTSSHLFTLFSVEM